LTFSSFHAWNFINKYITTDLKCFFVEFKLLYKAPPTDAV
jgi:hypothetical protein